MKHIGEIQVDKKRFNGGDRLSISFDENIDTLFIDVKDENNRVVGCTETSLKFNNGELETDADHYRDVALSLAAELTSKTGE